MVENQPLVVVVGAAVVGAAVVGVGVVVVVVVVGGRVVVVVVVAAARLIFQQLAACRRLPLARVTSLSTQKEPSTGYAVQPATEGILMPTRTSSTQK